MTRRSMAPQAFTLAVMGPGPVWGASETIFPEGMCGAERTHARADVCECMPAWHYKERKEAKP
jgi:hypothetical protein